MASKLRLLYQTVKWSKKFPFGERFHIINDYLSLYLSKGITLNEYYDFEFEKRSPEFIKNFLGLNEQRYYLDYLNPIKYYSLSRNKFLAHKMLEGTGVRKSTLYCYYHPEGKVSDSDMFATDFEGVYRIMSSKAVTQCVIKTTESSHGDNVRVVKAVGYLGGDCVLYYFNGEEAKLSDILGKTPLIFESLVCQTKQLADFNESSVNTVRFMTALYPDGTASVIGAFLKIGRAGICVDNAGDGGNIDTCVDVETGEIKYAIQFDGWRKIREIDCHPDSGFRLNGVVIKNWDTIKSEVISFQQAFPWCKAAGWDIAITDEGPVVIEVNDMWDRTGQYFIRRGWRKEIRDCYLAWKKEGKKYVLGRKRQDISKKHLIDIISVD